MLYAPPTQAPVSSGRTTGIQSSSAVDLLTSFCTIIIAVLPQQILQYRVLGQLGSGGMGEVYLAEDTQLHRKVAIKLLPADAAADAQANGRLLREARAAARLDHPNICAIYEVGEAGG